MARQRIEDCRASVKSSTFNYRAIEGLAIAFARNAPYWEAPTREILQSTLTEGSES